MSDREVLKPLVDRVLELSARPGEEARKELWAQHNALGKTDRIPVCVTFEGIPAPQWKLMLGENYLRCDLPLACSIEFDLRRRIWAAENIPDDHVVWPAVAVPAVAAAPDWGVPMEWAEGGDELGAKHLVAPFAEKIEMERLRAPRTAVDEEATSARLAQAAELLGGRLAAYPRYPTLGHSAFERAVALRGTEKIFFDVYDRPELVHAMMDFATGAMVADHQRREEHGWINAPSDPSGRYQMIGVFRHIASYLPAGFAGRGPRLADEWAYVSAQSSSGLGPDMYEEFVHRYNSRLAELFTAGTVYYHGCECLDQKLDVIATLPNLRRHHVSPWSSTEKAAEKYRGAVNLEVHDHPGKVFFGATTRDMRESTRALVRAAGGQPMSLNLSDIHSMDGRPETLRIWAQAAQEAAAASSA